MNLTAVNRWLQISDFARLIAVSLHRFFNFIHKLTLPSHGIEGRKPLRRELASKVGGRGVTIDSDKGVRT